MSEMSTDPRPGQDAAASAATPVAPPGPAAPPSAALVWLMAASCGLVVANLYYAQPLIGALAPALGLGEGARGLSVTLAQLGYAAGLLLLVPLGDLVENRRLICLTLAATVLALVGAALSPTAAPFLVFSALVGLGSVAVQMIVPVAAHLSPPDARGRVVGQVVSGLVLGILLARPLAGVVAEAFGWRAAFWGAAVATGLVALLLRARLPRRRPDRPAGAGARDYLALLRSLPAVWRGAPVLRRRTAYQAALFGGFTLFWTAVPLHLAASGYSGHGIALFSLAGAAGALAAPLAGRLADRGHTRVATGAALWSVLLAFALAAAGTGGDRVSLALLLLGAVLLDFGAQANLVLGQRAIYGLAPELRSRLNGLYAAGFFAGGAIGSAAVGPLMAWGGWPAVCALGAAAATAALCAFGFELLAAFRTRA